MTLFQRFPSYDQIIRGAAGSAARFPFTLFSALIGVVAGLVLVEPSPSSDPWILERLVVCGALGLPLFTALATLAEKRAWPGGRKILIQSLGVALLIIYFFSIPNKLDQPMHHLVRFALLLIGLHFLVAWLPWTGKDQLVGFWEYNKALFFRFLMSALDSSVLFIGLALALAAVDQLFGVDVKPVTYVRLFIIVAGIFNTWVFLAGVPKDYEALNRGGEYPNSLKVFTQFILLPLVVLYFVILIAYEAKIIITWNWPKGWVSELVLWYSVVGILSLLLLHPLRDRLENRWIQAISRWFYRGLLPLVAMLFLAIMRRISEYGITENRYFVLCLAIGLTIVVVYMIVSKRRDVRLIPLVICLLAFLSAYGPWSAFAVSQSSQQARLETLMIKNGLWANGAFQKPAEQPSFEARQEMSSGVTYLNVMHGIDAFSPWLADSTLRELDILPQEGRAELIAEELGLAYINTNWMSRGADYFHLVMDNQRPIDVSGYDLILPFQGISGSNLTTTFSLGQDSCRLEFDSAAASLIIRTGMRAKDTGTAAVVSLKEPLLALMEKSTLEKLSPQDLSFGATSPDTSVRVVLEVINGRRTKDDFEITWLSGFLLMRTHQ